MRVLLISEGSHEGHPDPARPQAMEHIVRRVLPPEVIYEWISVRDLPRGNPLPGKGGGHFKLALKAMWHATRERFDAVVLVTDADGHPERLREFEQAQENDRFDIPRALGIAVEEFDAWILADHTALSEALRTAISPRPLSESMRDSKAVCCSLMEEQGWEGSQAEFYAAVCAGLDLEAVVGRCPRGFQPFLGRLRQLASRLTEKRP